MSIPDYTNQEKAVDFYYRHYAGRSADFLLAADHMLLLELRRAGFALERTKTTRDDLEVILRERCSDMSREDIRDTKPVLYFRLKKAKLLKAVSDNNNTFKLESIIP